MTVLITLTTAGSDTGPFDLYSDLDGFVSAFETGVSKAALLGGYSSALVPDYTSTIRIKSTGVCTNYVDVLVPIPTTTTLAPLNFDIFVTCAGPNGTINLDLITGGSGSYEIGNGTFPDESTALANSSWVSAISLAVGVSPSTGETYWMVVRDSLGNILAKDVVADCSITTTTTSTLI